MVLWDKKQLSREEAVPGCPGTDSRAITELPVRDDVQILGSPLLPTHPGPVK